MTSLPVRVLLVVVFGLACGVGTHPEATWTASKGAAHVAGLPAPQSLAITGLVTGYVTAGPEILLDLEHPGAPETLPPTVVPSVVFVIEHPKGVVLFDAGVHVDDGECAYGFRPFFWVPCTPTDPEGVAGLLRRVDLSSDDVRAAVISHFHGDHAGGLAHLAGSRAPTVIASAPEWKAASGRGRLRHGYLRRHLEAHFDLALVEPRRAPVAVGFGPALDLMGDGSIWILPTGGHTSGHISLFVNGVGGPYLLTADASHLKMGFDLGASPGFAVDASVARESIERLKQVVAAHPGTRIFFGHEPSQWPRPGEEPVVRIHAR